MQYLLLIYGDEKKFDEVSKDAAHMAGYRTLREDLVAKKQLLGGERLQRIATATTVRVRDGKQQITDGPFAETREQLGGFFLVEAKDLDEATAIAARIPAAKVGSIEVRPIWQM
jgi:hypothetical protein